MSAKEALVDLASRSMKLALAKGAPEVLARVQSKRFFDVQFKNGEIETLQESHDRALVLRLFVQGRSLDAVTSDLSDASLGLFVDRAVAAAKLLDPDPCRSLPEADLMKDPPTADLKHFDAAGDAVSKDAKVTLARRAEAAVRAANKDVFYGESGYYEDRVETAFVTSSGFQGSDVSTDFNLSATAYFKDGEHKKRFDYSECEAVTFAALCDPEALGKEATERASRTIGAGPVTTGVYDIVFENRIAAWLLRNLFQPLSGSALHKDQSFLKDRLGRKIASELLSVADDPLRPAGLASRRFDGEGIPARARPILEAGVLRNYYLDTFYGRKLKLRPTSGRPSNVVVAPGKRDGAAILGDVDKGILVTRFLGGNSNSLTGDFSTGISGFLIEKGKATRPVSEVNIGGKLQDLLAGIVEIGNDPYPYSSVLVPTIRLRGVSVSGK
jgi:PmbA protein